jgi:hypothetical protein
MNKISEDESMKDKLSAWRKRRNEKFIQSLTPFQRWLYLSKDMGSREARADYLLSPEGNKELKKKFGEKLDKMPENWDDLKAGIEYDEGKDIKDFLKSILQLFAKSWGMH